MQQSISVIPFFHGRFNSFNNQNIKISCCPNLVERVFYAIASGNTNSEVCTIKYFPVLLNIKCKKLNTINKISTERCYVEY